MKLFEFIIRRRFYIWRGDTICAVYECMDEEGTGVKKKLTQGTQQHCERFVAEAQKQWMEWLQSNFTLIPNATVTRPPTTSDIEAKLPKPKMRKKKKTVEPPQITMTSSDLEQR